MRFSRFVKFLAAVFCGALSPDVVRNVHMEVGVIIWPGSLSLDRLLSQNVVQINIAFHCEITQPFPSHLSYLEQVEK